MGTKNFTEFWLVLHRGQINQRASVHVKFLRRQRAYTFLAYNMGNKIKEFAKIQFFSFRFMASCEGRKLKLSEESKDDGKKSI